MEKSIGETSSASSQLLNEEYNQLDQITPSSRSWRAKVIVIAKTPWRTSQNGKRYQNLILSDNMGNAVDAVIFGNDIDTYENIITENKAYVISNAIVCHKVGQYGSPFANTSYSWKINGRTSIYRSERPTNILSPFKKEFTSIVNCRNRPGEFINTLVVIVQKLDVRNPSPLTTIREYVAIDQSLDPIVVTFWNDTVSEKCYSYLDNIEGCPIVALIGFKVHIFKGTQSLSTTKMSLLVTKLDDDRYITLREW